jgi:hypothetical protein
MDTRQSKNEVTEETCGVPKGKPSVAPPAAKRAHR